MRILFLALTVFILTATTTRAQDVLYMKDGTLLRGKITVETDSTVTIEGTDYWKKVDKKDVDRIIQDSTWTSVHKQPGAPIPAPAPTQPIEIRQNPSVGETVLMTLGVLFLLGVVITILSAPSQ